MACQIIIIAGCLLTRPSVFQYTAKHKLIKSTSYVKGAIIVEGKKK